MCGMWCICVLEYPLYTIHLLLVLEVGGYWMVGENRLCIHLCNFIFFICIDELHRAYLIYLIHMLLLIHLAYISHLIYAYV